MLPGLATNGYALGGQSARFFYDGQYEQCYAASKQALEQDPHQLGVLPVHVAALVQLGHLLLEDGRLTTTAPSSLYAPDLAKQLRAQLLSVRGASAVHGEEEEQRA